MGSPVRRTKADETVPRPKRLKISTETLETYGTTDGCAFCALSMIRIITNLISLVAVPLPAVIPLYGCTSLETTFLILMTRFSLYAWSDSLMKHRG